MKVRLCQLYATSFVKQRHNHSCAAARAWMHILIIDMLDDEMTLDLERIHNLRRRIKAGTNIPQVVNEVREASDKIHRGVMARKCLYLCALSL